MKESLISTHNEQNQEPLETSETNFVLDAEINELKEKIKAIDEEKLSPEQKQTFKKIKDKIFGITKKIVRTVELVAVITSVLAVANYKRTHSELEVTKDKSVDLTISNEANIYKHEDERTTHILNVLAGREKFTENDLRNEWDGLLEEVFKSKQIKTDKKVVDMSIDEINEILNNLTKSGDKTFKIDDFKNGFFEQLTSINNTDHKFENLEINKNIYELVWQMEQECGNPEIRFTSENIRFTPFSEFAGSQHYDPINNIVYLNILDITPDTSYNRTLMGEMSHAKQFNDNQVGSAINTISDFVGIAKKGKFSATKLTDEYHKLYKKEGSIEHQAHKIIEPYLKEKYKFSSRKK